MEENKILTHLSKSGEANMVDVGAKESTLRKAVAKGQITMKAKTLELILKGDAKKGNVLASAKIAGIMAAKKTSDLIPLCHSLNLSKIAIDFKPFSKKKFGFEILATAITHGQTGVEMEALTAVSVAALTIYDMAKAVDREMVIEKISVWEKSGGKSGSYIKKQEEDYDDHNF